jgi:hypothetical protein
VFVEAAHELPPGLQGPGELGRAEKRHEVLHGFAGQAGQFRVGRLGRAGRGHHAPEILGRHGQGPVGQVAEVVGQVGVEPTHERLIGKARIRTEDHFAQEKVAHAGESGPGGHGLGLHHVAERFRHLGVAHEPVAVDVEALVERHVHGEQHGGPKHGIGA